MKSLAAILIAILVFTAGLLAFGERVRRSTPPAEPVQADAIVALTGGAEDRIEEAMALLEADKGRRLLVSGVNPQVRREELRQAVGAPRNLYACCVDLGFQAENTVGNAQETAAWARAKSFRRLIVVTSDYHMPRALLELRGAAPEAQLEPYAVRTPVLDSARWWKTSKGARLMTVEYCKYLVVLIREGVVAIGRHAHAAQRPAGAAST